MILYLQAYTMKGYYTKFDSYTDIFIHPDLGKPSLVISLISSENYVNQSTYDYVLCLLQSLHLAKTEIDRIQRKHSAPSEITSGNK